MVNFGVTGDGTKAKAAVSAKSLILWVMAKMTEMMKMSKAPTLQQR